MSEAQKQNGFQRRATLILDGEKQKENLNVYRHT